MCLGLVMKVINVGKDYAICDYFGNKTKVRIDFISNVKVNDYLLIHAGFAISKLAKNEGEERIKLFKELEGYEDE